MTLATAILASAACCGFMLVLDTLRHRAIRRADEREHRQRLDDNIARRAAECGLMPPPDVVLRRAIAIEELSQQLTREGMEILDRERTR